MSEESEIARSHAYINLLYSAPERLGEIPLISEEIAIKTARGLAWRVNWLDARTVLDAYLENHEMSSALLAELTIIDTRLGDYHTAKNRLAEFSWLKDSDEFGVKLSACWLTLLEEDTVGSAGCLEDMISGYLYIPSDSLFPAWAAIGRPELMDEMKRDTIRYPKKKAIFDDLINLSVTEQHWEDIDHLITSIGSEREYPFAFSILAEALIKNNELDRLGQLLSRWAKRFHSRDYLDYSARFYLARREPKRLKEIVDEYIQRYPDLLDGHIYLADYYRLTGQIKKMEEEKRRVTSLLGE